MMMFLDVQAANEVGNQVNIPSPLRRKKKQGQINVLKPNEPRKSLKIVKVVPLPILDLQLILMHVMVFEDFNDHPK